MRILVVEDDADFGELVSRHLREHFTVDQVGSYEEARDYLESFRYDVMLIDRMLKGADRGLDLIARLKSRSPEACALVISAKDETEEKIYGLERGADDYLQKPLHLGELLARIRALIRRRQPDEVVIKDVRLNLVDRQVWVSGEAVTLTRMQNDLLFALARRAGRVVSREELTHALYEDPASVASNTIEVLMRKLRNRLPPGLIKTVKTRGYLLEV